MSRLLGICALVLLFGLPAFSQAQRMSPEDQARFNSYYSRWQQDRQTNNRDDMVSTEHHMQDLMNKYDIPSDTPYDEIASQNNMEGAYNRDTRDSYRWAGRMSPDDQRKFNDEYRKWQDANAKNDRDDIDKHARNMEGIMARNGIPPNTPFDQVAASNGYAQPQYNHRDFRGRLSPDDQRKFDKAYQHWVNDRQKNDRDDIAKDEGKMQEIMAKYNIPRDVSYDSIASGTNY